MSKWDHSPPAEILTSKRPTEAPQPQQSYQNHWRSPSNASNNGTTPTVYYVQSPAAQDGETPTPARAFAIGGGGKEKPMSMLLSSSSTESTPMASPGGSPYRERQRGKSYGKMRPKPIKEGLEEQQQEEEEMVGSWKEDDTNMRNIRKIVLCILAIASFLVLLFLVMWLVLRPPRPKLSLKGVDFQYLNILTGVDNSGVPTTMFSFNSTIKVDISNRSPFLQVHVEPFEIGIYLSELLLSTNQVADYVQEKNSKKVVSVNIYGENVPIYGASYTLSTSNDASSKGYNVPFNLVTSVRAHYLVVGHMITSNFWTRKTCNITINTKTLSLLTPIANACSNL